MVRVVRLERTVSWSQTRRDTNFAIPGYSISAIIPRWRGKSKFFLSVVIPAVKAAFMPLSATGGNPANTGVARLCGVSPCPVPDTATALPKQARYQLRYTRLFSFLSGWSYSPKSSAIPASLFGFVGGVNLYVGRCVRETPPARQRHGALTVQTGFVRGGVGETTLILPCSAGKSNRVQADFLPAPCFAYPPGALCVSASLMRLKTQGL